MLPSNFLFTDECRIIHAGQCPVTIEDRILYRDDHLIAIDKPSGMPPHAGPGCEGVSNLLNVVRDLVGAWVYLPHRLDRATSGVIVLARNQDVARVLNHAFANREVTKTYQAIVRGWVTKEQTITRPLGRIEGEGEQAAESHVNPLGHLEAPWPVRPFPTSRYTLVELTPHTGRTHQLRRHLAGMAHPIVGDTKYGDGAHNKAFREQMGIHRLLLHAMSLEFRHPVTGVEMVVRSRRGLVAPFHGSDGTTGGFLVTTRLP